MNAEGVLPGAIPLCLAALVGLAFSLAEWRACVLDNRWRQRRSLNGVGRLVARNAAEQEVTRSGRMLLYLLVVVLGLDAPVPRTPGVLLFLQEGGILLALVVLLDVLTVARKAGLRRRIRMLELEHLGRVVRLDAGEGGT